MALDDPLDEHEQSERVLAWLRENGMGLVAGLVLGLAAIAGWKWWDQHRLQQWHADADRYQNVLNAIEAGDPEASTRLAELGDDIYADLAGLDLAAAQVDAGDNAAAIKTLQGLKVDEPGLVDIVNQRLARLLVDAGQAEEALQLVAGADSASALEVRGDARYALGQTEAARSDYSEALTRLDVASPRRQLLELKLIEVGGAPAGTGAQS